MGWYFTIDGKEQKFGDSCPREMIFLPIMVLEAKALLYVLNSIRESIRECRVDTHVDNPALIGALECLIQP